MAKASASNGERQMQALVPVFEETVLPHLDAAYNLARWLTRNDRDAEDVVQESFLRALRHFRTFKGGDARPWLLAIVRNTCYTWLKHNRFPEEETIVDDDKHPHSRRCLRSGDAAVARN